METKIEINSDSENEVEQNPASENEVYQIYSFPKNSNFFKSKSTKFIEDDSKSAMNSASCKQFALTETEASELQKCKLSNSEIDEKVQALGKLQKKNNAQIKAIRFTDDDELKKLLEEKITNKHRHEIICHIDRIDRKVEVTIKNCEDEYAISTIFNNFLKSSPSIKREGRAEDIDNHLRLVVTFKLHERDRLVEGLKLSNEAYKIPEARQYFQGC
ncbi:hypothetical protein [Legionella fallonii]|uniref:Uncharacterized protein n=1 Tax=Legionella fallonii LLAP-10 TaxID=1212491 RepID=A0A098G0F6_9GAMM|nr:hypothetical protein [Legionella fallonii]CEG55948.1 protein of unknown function [Legionella fallonii LLAP-10]